MNIDDLISPPGTLLWCALWKPEQSKFTGKLEYIAKLGFDAEAMASPEIRMIKDALAAEAKDRWGRDYETMGIRQPFYTAFDPAKNPPGTVATVNFKCNEDHPPTVVGPDARPVMDQAQVYAGISARVSVRCYAYGQKGTAIPPGLGLGLQNLQKLADGKRRGGGGGDGSEFGRWSGPDGGDSGEGGDVDPLDELVR